MSEQHGRRRDGAARGPSTRAVHAGLPEAAQGEPLLPGPVFAAPYHLRGEAAESGYGRDFNPTWSALERALGELDGGESVVFASGMAALSAVVLGRLRPGDLLLAGGDAYPGIRKVARERLEPMGVRVRLVGTEELPGAAAAERPALVWVETPANPGLECCDVAAVVEAAAGAGALVAVDNTLATPLGQRPLGLGADVAVLSGTKLLAGHSDLLLGAVSVRDPALARELRAWRTQVGAVPGPFEAWLAHRSLATLGLRLERSSANALAVARALAARGDVRDVRYPGLGDPVAARQMDAFGPVVAFTLDGAARAQRFLDACSLVADATSFGGVHSTAERRARWGTDDVPEGFIRFSAGCEDTADLVADVLAALDRAG